MRGIASAVNNDVARATSLIAVAVLPAAAGLTGTAYLHAQFSPDLAERRSSRRAYAWPEACWPPSPSATLVQKADRHSSSCCIALWTHRHRQPSRTDDFVWLWQLRGGCHGRSRTRRSRSVKTHAMSHPSSASRFSWRNSSSCGTSSSVPMTKSATSFRSSSRNAAKLVILAIISDGPERD
jgi:hypothetical protein